MTMRNWKNLLGMALMGVMALTFSACGDDGDDDDSSGSRSEDQFKPVDYENLLLGFWKGTGTNLDGNPLEVGIRFNADKTGSLVMTTSVERTHFVAAIKNWYYTPGHIELPSERFDYPMSWTITGGSIESGHIRVSSQGYEGQYWGDFELSQTEKAGGDSSTEVSSDDVESVTALVILYVGYPSESYSDSKKVCYKKTSGDRVVLYSNSSCTNLIGKASLNSDSKCGPYKVSSYTYRVLDATLEATRYYYFN